MHSFVRKLVTEWRRLKLPTDGQTIVVAVSGGADSVSLLLALNELRKTAKLRLRIVAAHLNHQLRGPESDADEEFVRHLTSELGTELVFKREHISHEGNLEQNARDVRYHFLTETATNLNAFAVLTGHTLNDQAETFLLNLIRGSGVDGLAGVPVIRTIDDASSVLLIRPLLDWAQRADTETFCHYMGIAYRYDTMNEDSAYKRVRIRKVLLPLLEDFNPKIVEILANTAGLLRRTTERIAVNDGNENSSLRLKELRFVDKNELYSVLRRWLSRNRGSLRSIGLKHIEAIERLAFSVKSGRRVELPGGSTVVKSNGKLVFERLEVEK